jgi:hypothetical protein
MRKLQETELERFMTNTLNTIITTTDKDRKIVKLDMTPL